jgi:hypothetical protein
MNDGIRKIDDVDASDEQQAVDSDLEMIISVHSLVTKLKTDNAALTREINYTREQYAARCTELEAMSAEVDLTRNEIGHLRSELDRHVRTAREALSGFLDLERQHIEKPRAPAARPYIVESEELPRAVRRGPAAPRELIERPSGPARIIAGLRDALG